MPGYPDITPSWLKPENASVLDSTLTKVVRMLAQALGADDPASQVMGLMGTDIPAKGAQAVAKGIKAYHGSPHDFDKFQLSKIGTGEGAQAYGHGLYFAENEAVAKQYRDDLSRPILKHRGEPLPEPVKGRAFLQLTDDQVIDEAARDFIRDARKGTPDNATLDDIVAYATGQARVTAHRDAAQRGYWLSVEQRIKEMASDLKVQDGRMYEVNIKADPKQFLDWDAPLSQQSEHVRERLGSAGFAPQQPAEWAGHEYYSRLGREVANKEGQYVQPVMGSAFPGNGWTATRARSEASEALKQAGIPGIKYLDQGSRGAGEGTRNYVVFDDSLIDILKKYGLAGLAAGGAQQFNLSPSPTSGPVKGLFDE